MRILAISGALRSGSSNTALLRAAAEEAPAGVELVLWDGLREIPPFDQDDDLVPGPTAVEALRDAVREADAVLFATPEYNSSVPGALKNAPALAPMTATGLLRNAFGAVWSQAELRKVLGAMGARVAEVEVAVGHATEKLDEQGELIEET